MESFIPLLIAISICLTVIYLATIVSQSYRETLSLIDKKLTEHNKANLPAEIPQQIQDQLDGLKSQLSSMEMARGISTINRR
jgi:hypothetical protein